MERWWCTVLVYCTVVISELVNVSLFLTLLNTYQPNGLKKFSNSSP
jgi:hypothetical protein